MLLSFLKLALALNMQVTVEQSSNYFIDYGAYPVQCWVLDSVTVCKVTADQVVVFV